MKALKAQRVAKRAPMKAMKAQRVAKKAQMKTMKAQRVAKRAPMKAMTAQRMAMKAPYRPPREIEEYIEDTLDRFCRVIHGAVRAEMRSASTMATEPIPNEELRSSLSEMAVAMIPPR